MVKQAIEIYNKKRRHYSLELQTPEFTHINQIIKYKSYMKNKIAILKYNINKKRQPISRKDKFRLP